MKLKTYAQQQGISYLTAYRWWRNGDLQGHQTPSGMILIDAPKSTIRRPGDRVAVYARENSNQNRVDAEAQAERLQQWTIAAGYRVVSNTIEIASGLDDQRPKLDRLMASDDWDILVIEHRDRLTRYGYAYLEGWAECTGRRIITVNETTNQNDNDLIEDLTSVITSTCQQLYGCRRAVGKTERMIVEMRADDVPA